MFSFVEVFLVRSRIHQARNIAERDVIISPINKTELSFQRSVPASLNMLMSFGRVLPYSIRPMPTVNRAKTAGRLMAALTFIGDSVFLWIPEEFKVFMA